MDRITGICTFVSSCDNFLCFVTIIQVMVISGHQVKKSSTKFGI